MKKTILNELNVWSAFQRDHGIDFNGFFWVRPDGGHVLFDPLPLGEADVAFIRERGGARFILLTNADHWRGTDRARETFRAEVYAPAPERERLARDGRRADHAY